MNNRTALVKLQPEAFQALDTIAERANMSLMEAKGAFVKAHTLATAIQELQSHIEPMMDAFMPLQNTTLGFKTDNQAGYPKDVVRDAVIEATLRGVQTVGNQFNIISGRCYITREGYEHKLRNLKGLTKLKIDIGVPKMHPSGEGAIVECNASWEFNGAPDSKKAEIPVRVNKGMGGDAIIGKVERKFRKRVFEQITGCTEADDAMEEGGADRVVKPANVTAVETPSFGQKQEALNV